ncbi:MAG: hypothetical protein IPI90_19625 [Saprospiraceae bacterium]|nr:hypothetical protein [Candidatus Vicinibacter affinis]
MTRQSAGQAHGGDACSQPKLVAGVVQSEVYLDQSKVDKKMGASLSIQKVVKSCSMSSFPLSPMTTETSSRATRWCGRVS